MPHACDVQRGLVLRSDHAVDTSYLPRMHHVHYNVSVCIRKIHAYGTYQRYELAIWVISKRWGQAKKCELCKQLSGEDETCKALLPGVPGWKERRTAGRQRRQFFGLRSEKVLGRQPQAQHYATLSLVQPLCWHDAALGMGRPYRFLMLLR